MELGRLTAPLLGIGGFASAGGYAGALMIGFLVGIGSVALERALRKR